jgi:dipeptidyl aminopeptidase/acylaminoacyl peptidase
MVNGFLVRPSDGKPGKRPTILDIHGGPVGQFGHEFDFSWHYFAAHGYNVVAMNPRGSSGRGQAFTQAIYAEWGKKDAQDVLAGIDHVVARGIADADRLGVGGWSYGAILTNYVIAQDTRFKAAVSGAGISNILAGYGTDQYIREYENELGTPWKNPEAYLKLSSPFLHADRIVTPTLFMCGEYDFNVPLLNTEQMYQALRSLGRDTQLVIYPGEYHGIRTPSYERDRLERNVAWFDKYLKAASPGIPGTIQTGPPEAPTDRPDPARN